jgi:hypothetical protein
VSWRNPKWLWAASSGSRSWLETVTRQGIITVDLFVQRFVQLAEKHNSSPFDPSVSPCKCIRFILHLSLHWLHTACWKVNTSYIYCGLQRDTIQASTLFWPYKSALRSSHCWHHNRFTERYVTWKIRSELSEPRLVVLWIHATACDISLPDLDF